MTSAISSSLTALAGVSLLLVLIYGPWQEVCTAYARQIIFEKRDAIFDLAISGRLSFNDPNYRTIRALLEKSIRFAHEVTIPRLAFYYFELKRRGKSLDGPPELLKAVERIEDLETKKEVRRLVDAALNTLVLMAVAKSPAALLALMPVYIIVIVAHIGRSLARTLRDNSQAIIQIEAERVGSSLDLAAA
jgi:hypothetical protein